MKQNVLIELYKKF